MIIARAADPQMVTRGAPSARIERSCIITSLAHRARRALVAPGLVGTSGRKVGTGGARHHRRPRAVFDARPYKREGGSIADAIWRALGCLRVRSAGRPQGCVSGAARARSPYFSQRIKFPCEHSWV